MKNIEGKNQENPWRNRENLGAKNDEIKINGPADSARKAEESDGRIQ